MPEGAEVRIISEDLAKKIGTRKIQGISPVSGRYTKKSISGLHHVHDAVKEKGSVRVIGVGVKGKLIFFILSDDLFLLNTLGMTGGWSEEESHKYGRVRFDFDVGSPVFFTDMRNFGTLKIVKGKREFLKKLDSLGPDMLNEDVSFEQFLSALDKKPHWPICKTLMNQSVVCGVGNYVKAEALYRSKISPHRLVGSLSSSEISLLHKEIKGVLSRAYKAMGASIRDYTNLDGKKGDAASQFLVYGKKRDPAGNEVIKETTQDGRTTHWVPNVQK
tara:strand:- start:192 stop:1013 length:822 start_codon:yes stop_codon:yes gene_type:complete